MPVKLYIDHQVPRAITIGLRLRGVEIVTAFEDGASRLDDAILLDRASTLGCVLFSQDEDLLVEAARRQREGRTFAGVIFARQLHVSIAKCINDLEIIAKVGEPEDLANCVEFLPL